MLAGDRTEMPGMIRASFGLYNTEEEIDHLVEALERIERGDYQGRYTQYKATGEFIPMNWKINPERFFSFLSGAA
jgi:hypothetical protein